MGLCCSRPVDPQPGEYDPMGALIGGESPVADLSRPLRDLVKQGRVLFWRDEQLCTPAYYFTFHTPFLLESADGRRKVNMRRKQEEEESNRLVFEGVCVQGFVYTLSITAQMRETSHRSAWGHQRRGGRNVKYTGNLNWVKRAETPADYGVDYTMMIWR